MRTKYSGGVIVIMTGMAIVAIICLVVLLLELFGPGFERTLDKLFSEGPEYEPAKVIIVAPEKPNSWFNW